MIWPALTAPGRHALVGRIASLEAQLEATQDLSRARAIAALLEQTLDEYLRRLPIVPLSCCPICQQPLLRSYDPFGLNGPWWLSEAPRVVAPQCPHFCVLRGAVHFGARAPQGPEGGIHTGPEVPYVIPRLLEQPGMLAVITRLALESAVAVYTIGYFALRRPPAEELTADWPDARFAYTDAFGETGSREASDSWDFELAPWIERGKLAWWEPGAERPVVERCPYLDLPGRRAQLVVGPHGVEVSAPPSSRADEPRGRVLAAVAEDCGRG